MAMPQFGFGYKLDTHDKSKDFSARGLLGAMTSPLPGNYSMESLMIAIYNQLQTSSCVGWALAQAIWLRLKKLGVIIDLPSPQAIYTFALAMQAQMDGDNPDAGWQDDGCQPNIAVAGLTKWGVPSIVAYPFDPNNVTRKPTLKELGYASSFQIQETGYARVFEGGGMRTQMIKQALADGYPVFIGTQVDRAFMGYNGKGLVTAPNGGQIVGGHGMHLVGYRPNAGDSTQTDFRGVNQWGTGWGDSGMYWADQSFIESELMTDVYIMMVMPTGHSGMISSGSDEPEGVVTPKPQTDDEGEHDDVPNDDPADPDAHGLSHAFDAGSRLWRRSAGAVRRRVLAPSHAPML